MVRSQIMVTLEQFYVCKRVCEVTGASWYKTWSQSVVCQ